MSPWFKHKPLFSLQMILLLALLLRLLFVSLLNPNGYYFSDTRHYDRAAQSLLNGQGFGEKYYRAPLYPLLMAAVYGVVGHSFTAMRCLECLLGVWMCWLIYRLVARWYGDRAALWAALIAALFPHFILLTGILYPTNLFTLLLLSALMLLLKADNRPDALPVIGSGLLAALASLTVASFFFIVPVWLIWLVCAKGGKGWKKALLFSITFMVVLSPWTLRNYQKYGRLTLVQPLPHTVLPNLQDRTLQEQEVASGFQSTVKYLKEHPSGTGEDGLSNTIRHYFFHPFAALRHLLHELAHFWALYPDRLDTARDEYRSSVHAKDSRMQTQGSHWHWVKWPSVLVMGPVFAFALIGCVLAMRSQPRATSLLVLSILSFSIGYSLIYAEVRYRIPVEPLLLSWTALAWEKLLHRFPSGQARSSEGHNSAEDGSDPVVLS